MTTPRGQSEDSPDPLRDPDGGIVLTRREALAGMLLGWLLTGARGADAVSGYARRPACDRLRGKTVRWLVGYSPGGGYDAYSRLLEPVLERELEARIVVHNLPGAAGLVAARTLASSAPDGRTLGILDGPGLLLANRRGLAGAPDLETDLMPLARIARLHPMLVTSGDGGIKTIDGLIERARSGPLVAGITGTFSQNFVNCAVSAYLFGLEIRFVAGFPGSTEVMLALARGDVDYATADADSVREEVASGRLAPILHLSRLPPPSGSRLDGVPHLAGDAGVATRRPEIFALGGPHLREVAEGLVAFTSLGRLLVGPRGLDPGLAPCIKQALGRALDHPEFRASAARARRSLDTASAPEVEREVAQASAAVAALLPIVEDAARRIG